MRDLVLSIVERYGLDLKGEHVERVISEIERLGIEDPKIAEKVAISELDVGESYFFRDRETWVALKNILGKRERVKALSLGCSEGEEVYTFAFVAGDVGVDYEITGVDVCDWRIEKAKVGVYEPRKLRVMNVSEVDRYFEAAEGSYRVRDEYRKGVDFLVGNILEYIPSGPNDFIMLRRVLIYFDGETTKKILKSVGERLKEEGFLILGKGEIYEELFEDYEPVPFPNVVFWRKRKRGKDREFEIEAAVEIQTVGTLSFLKKLLNLGNYDRVVEITENMMKNGFVDREMMLHNIVALIYSGREEEAKERIENALSLFPGDPDFVRLKRVIF